MSPTDLTSPPPRPDLRARRDRGGALSRKRRVLGTLRRGVHGTLGAWLLGCALGPWLALDRFRPGMLLTYPPRVVCASLALLLAIRHLARLRRAASAGLVAIAVALLASGGWGGGARSPTASATELRLLSLNVHDRVEHAGELAELCDREGIDLLSLQEVKPLDHQAVVDGMPAFVFFRGDESLEFEYSNLGPFSSLVGIRREHLSDADLVEIETAITGYRTFAVHATVRGEPLWIVNVHTTKPVRIDKGLLRVVLEAGSKAARHRKEHAALAAWLEAHDEHPVLVAGDFNAPLGTENLRLPGFTHAHLEAGSGLHLSFPRTMPIIGIDHTLANRHLRFLESRLVDLGFSDHRAQIVRFERVPTTSAP